MLIGNDFFMMVQNKIKMLELCWIRTISQSYNQFRPNNVSSKMD